MWVVNREIHGATKDFVKHKEEFKLKLVVYDGHLLLSCLEPVTALSLASWTSPLNAIVGPRLTLGLEVTGWTQQVVVTDSLAPGLPHDPTALLLYQQAGILITPRA